MVLDVGDFSERNDHRTDKSGVIISHGCFDFVVPRMSDSPLLPFSKVIYVQTSVDTHWTPSSPRNAVLYLLYYKRRGSSLITGRFDRLRRQTRWQRLDSKSSSGTFATL